MSISQIKNSPNIKKTSVTIQSNDRTSGDTSNFTYDLGTTITDIRLITINQVEFENQIYNINEFNNQFAFISPLGVTTTITIDPSTYPVDRISTVLATELNNNTDSNVVFTVSFDDYEKITFKTAKGVTTFGLNFNVSNSIGELLGFDDSTNLGVTSTTSIVPLNLIYTKNVFVGSTHLGSNLYDEILVSSGVSNAIHHIDLDGNFGDIVLDKDQNDIRTNIPNVSIIDIVLRDDYNRIVSLNNTNFVITLDFYSRVFNDSFSI